MSTYQKAPVNLRQKMHIKSKIYINKKPNGHDRVSHIDKIANLDNQMNKLKDLHTISNYKQLRNACNWATVFRAGFIIIYSNPIEKLCELLLVYQKATQRYLPNGSYENLPIRKGFPKGSSNRYDKSALDTAIRETKEETGIDICDPANDAKIVPSLFTILRPEYGVEEMFIYFIAVISSKPQIILDNTELVGYEWINMEDGLRGIQNTTIPTMMMLKILEDINVWNLDSTTISV